MVMMTVMTNLSVGRCNGSNENEEGDGRENDCA